MPSGLKNMFLKVRFSSDSWNHAGGWILPLVKQVCCSSSHYVCMSSSSPCFISESSSSIMSSVSAPTCCLLYSSYFQCFSGASWWSFF